MAHATDSLNRIISLYITICIVCSQLSSSMVFFQTAPTIPIVSPRLFMHVSVFSRSSHHPFVHLSLSVCFPAVSPPYVLSPSDSVTPAFFWHSRILTLLSVCLWRPISLSVCLCQLCFPSHACARSHARMNTTKVGNRIWRIQYYLLSYYFRLQFHCLHYVR